MKQHQLIAALKGIKTRTENAFTETYKLVQKPDLFSGLSRKYEPIDDAGEKKPPEHKKLQQKVPDIIKTVEKHLSELMDNVATMENTNTKARADVVVGETTLLKSVPVATLLFLEHKLKDLHTFVEKLPTLDPTETWNFDTTQACYTTDAVKSAGKAKARKAFVLAPATDKHPAQTQMVEDEVITGYWTTNKFSGAIPAPRQAQLLERVQKLQKAVKYAREEANSVAVEEAKIGERVLGFVFAE